MRDIEHDSTVNKSNKQNVHNLANKRHSVALERLTNTIAERDQELLAATQQLDVLKQKYTRCNLERQHAVARELKARLNGNYDELTGLANRTLLEERLVQALAQGARHHRIAALILLQLDDFETIQQRLGPSVAAEILRTVGSRLLAITRVGDTVCRYDVNEFVVLLPEVDGLNMVEAVAIKVQLALAKPYLINHERVLIQVNTGNANYPRDGTTCNTLVRSANADMYRAKTELSEGSTLSGTIEGVEPFKTARSNTTTRLVHLPSYFRGH